MNGELRPSESASVPSHSLTVVSRRAKCRSATRVARLTARLVFGVLLGASAGGCADTKPSSSVASQASHDDPVAVQRTATIVYVYTLMKGVEHLDAEIKEKQIPFAEQYSRWSMLFITPDSRNVDPMIVKASVRLGRAYGEAENYINRFPETAVSAIFESLANGNSVGVVNDHLIAVKKIDDEIGNARLDWAATIPLMVNKYCSK